MRHFLHALVVSTALASTAAADPLSDQDRQRVLSHFAMTDAWLASDRAFATPALVREAYVTHLTQRLRAPRAFIEEARRARSSLV